MAVVVAALAAALVPTPAHAGDGSSKDQAVILPALPTSLDSSTTNDSTKQLSPTCGTAASGYGARWFRLDNPTFVTAAIDVTSSATLDVSVFRQADSALVPIGCGATTEPERWVHLRQNLLSNTTYFIAVSARQAYQLYNGSWVYIAAVAPFSLAVGPLVAPVNDEQSGAISITALPTVDRRDFLVATNSPEEPVPSCADSGEMTAWYRIDLTGRQGVEVITSQRAAVAIRDAAGRELRCNRLPGGTGSGYYDADVTRLRPSYAGHMYVQIASQAAMSVSFIYRNPPPNDDFSHPVVLRRPDVFTGEALPVMDVQDGVMSSLEPGEPLSPDTVGTLWWLYTPDHHTFVSARAADAYESDGCVFCFNGRYGAIPGQSIRVFEAYNGVIGREIPLDRTLSANDTVRWLATGGTPYAIQLSLTSLARVTFYLTLNPQGFYGLCNYNSCIL